MPNICSYSMAITGKIENVEEMIEIIQADYNCTADDPLHLWRVFEAYETDREVGDDGITTAYLNGDCAWSVSSCMLSGGYNKDKDETQNGTTLEIETKRLGLVIEIFSEECGMCFMEHYIIANGDFITNEVVNWTRYYIEDFEDAKEFNDATGENWTQEQFKEYDEDYYEIGGIDWDFEDGESLYKEYVLTQLKVEDDIEPVSEDELNAILAC